MATRFRTLTVPISGMGYSYIAVSLPWLSGGARHEPYGGDYRYATDAPVGTAFTYYVFEYSADLPSSTIGAELYDASSNILSSNYHLCRCSIS